MKKIITTIAALSLLGLGAALFANAQTVTDFMVTWKANNYAPADYRGKILPIDGTRIDVAFELIANNRLANLSGTSISWRVNNAAYQTGIGLKTISFTADASKGDQVVDIAFTYLGAALTKRIVIPVTQPEVVITGGPDIFRALLYFFNLSTPTQAKFTWTVNGQSVEATGQNPDVLALSGTIPSGSELAIHVDVQNLLRSLEVAANTVQFIKP